LRSVFPGERRVWLSAAVVLAPLLAILAHELTKQRAYYTSTDSIGVVSLDVTVAPGQRLCVPDVEIGAGTAAVEWSYYPMNDAPRPPMSVTVRQGNRLLASGSIAGGPFVGLSLIAIPISPVVPASPPFRLVTVCLRLGAGTPTQFAGMDDTGSLQRPVTLSGVSQGANRIALWFLPRTGSTRSLLQDWSGVMDRLSLFRPAFAGQWFYWLMFLLGVPLIFYVTLRLVAVAEEPRRRVVLTLALIAFASNAGWAVTTAAFDSPDEPEHFAYVESLAETGRPPDSTPSARSPYASDEGLALAATRHFATVTGSFGLPPWAPLEVARYREALAAQEPPRDDGGGYAVATSVHSPVYYSLLVPGYELGRGGGTFAELFWTRMISALLGIIVPLCAYGVVRELAPARRRLAVTAGLLVALDPMFSFISGAVNNDVGVNGAAAVLVYLVVRALRRGLSWPLAIALGVTAAVTPLMKGTGYALYPALIVALAILCVRAGRRLWERRSAQAMVGLRNLAIAAVAFAATDAIWGSIAAGLGRTTVTTPGGTVGSTAAIASSGFGGKLVYLWEVFFPRLPFMHAHWNPGQWPFFDIYVERGIGGLGWYSVYFEPWVYDVVVWVMIAAAALALYATWVRRRAVRARWVELLFLMLVAVGVIAAVEYVYYAVTPRPVLAEQGRYAFTALVPIGALAIAGLFGLPKRWATSLAAMLVAAMLVLAVAARLLYITTTYT
jgi:4-amino-4-deoxy-L-arabinose transferase-like glycosyltransferase